MTHANCTRHHLRATYGVRSLFMMALLALAAGACVTVTDDEGESDSEPQALSAGNLVQNPSFEQDTSKWYGWQSSLRRVARSAAPDGTAVALVTRTSGTSYTIGTQAPLVAAIPAGASYRATVSVAAATSAALGKPATLILRERNASGQVAKLWTSTSKALASQFQTLSVTASAPTAGNVLDLYVIQGQAASGHALYVDAFDVVRTSTSAPAPDAGTPPPADPGTSQSAKVPTGPGGTWTLVFDDEFDGTTLDTSKWSPNWFGEGGKMNNVGTYAANVAVSGGNLLLTLASSTSGALVHTGYGAGRYQLPVGGYTEARVYFPGDTTRPIYNWPAWWASGPSWPSAGEHDIAEGLGGKLTVNYHSPSGAHNQGAIAGTWYNAFHVYGVHRKATSADVYWDGKLVKSYPTDDNGAGEELILNVGASGSATAQTGTAGTVKVDYVRAWK